MSESVNRKPIDRWIPWMFVLFFVVVLAVNGVMVYVASASWTGLETKQHYIKGLDYNRTLDAVAQQKALGWAGDLSVETKAAGRVRLDFSLRDRNAGAIAGATVTARLVRPTSEGHDVDVRLDDFGRGHYAAAADIALSGQWDVHILARHPSGDFRLTRRIMVP